MKYLFYPLLFALLISVANGQTPKPVYSFALVKESPQWYKEQAKAWGDVVKKEPQNALAWYYYYYATRDLLATDPDDNRPDSTKAAVRLELVKSMEKAIPNTYEYHLCTWKEHVNDDEYSHHLKKVYELGEGRVEHIDFIINDGEFERNKEKRDKALIRKWEAGLLSPGMANYNRNVLAGLSPNSILITVGDNDTYPAWYVQATGYRSDVYVLNLSLLLVDDYRNKVFKELGVEAIKIDWNSKGNQITDFYKKLIPALNNNSKGYDLHIGLTAMGVKDLIADQEDHLYLTGLTYKYDTESVDEKALLKRNFEHRYALDYLQQSFYLDISSSLVRQINLNYTLPMLKLYEHYHVAGDITQKEWLKALLTEVVRGSEYEKEVTKLMQQCSN